MENQDKYNSTPFKNNLLISLWNEDFPVGTTVEVRFPCGEWPRTITTSQARQHPDDGMPVLDVENCGEVPLRICHVVGPIKTPMDPEVYGDMDARKPHVG